MTIEEKKIMHLLPKGSIILSYETYYIDKESPYGTRSQRRIKVKYLYNDKGFQTDIAHSCGGNYGFNE